ncbi:hypothetical protein [Rhizobium sp. BK251]|uniref:hypothetical protein n=1 Tax=Rhizobium sp. BK251 TaxID=2512125 RepID=UPI00104EC263|nr:hypothetical protein [Rhizobium sp. BK251]TCL75488.1 hypothetical protein EV286_10126 [Rhizobium sp. BK251]
MSGLETAIRNALERSDRANPEVRARIYQSARQALEAGLRKQDITDAATVSAQRQRLESTIRMIEGEERGHVHANPHVNPNPQVQSQAHSQARAGMVPPVVEMPTPSARSEAGANGATMDVRGETRDRPGRTAPERDVAFDGMSAGPADHLGAPVADEPKMATPRGAMDFKPERAVVRRRPRKFFSRLLVYCVLLAFLGMGGWWVYSSGLLLSPAERDTSVANPPARTESEDFTGTDDQESESTSAGAGAVIDPQNGFSEEWIEVFTPSDTSKIQAGTQTSVESAAGNDGPSVRLISTSNDEDGNIAIEVPAEVLQQLGGKSSTIALTLQSTTDEPTQITVQCDFQTLGNCARHRFNVTREKTDALFQVSFDRSTTPNAPGRLILNSDVDGKARGINLYAIRILPGQ